MSAEPAEPFSGLTIGLTDEQADRLVAARLRQLLARGADEFPFHLGRLLGGTWCVVAIGKSGMTRVAGGAALHGDEIGRRLVSTIQEHMLRALRDDPALSGMDVGQGVTDPSDLS